MKHAPHDHAVALVVAIFILLGAACGGGGDLVVDSNPAWDTDGDGISNAVELESHNKSLYGLDPNVFNRNPSIASGTVSSGDLLGGLNLPDTGTGYIHYLGGDQKDTDDWGTLSMINVLEAAGRNYRGQTPCNFSTTFQSRDDLARPQYGDMSLQLGGPFDPHQDHQNGLETDVRYLAVGPRSSAEGPLDLADPNGQQRYDQQSTLELIQCFLNDIRVVAILYDQELTGIVPGVGEGRLIDRNAIGDHTNHFHVRILDPDGTNN
ncbi:MAG: hypothetical protein ACHQU8_00795 [Gemmatimonadales bacterium]